MSKDFDEAFGSSSGASEDGPGPVGISVYNDEICEALIVEIIRTHALEGYSDGVGCVGGREGCL